MCVCGCVYMCTLVTGCVDVWMCIPPCSFSSALLPSLHLTYPPPPNHITHITFISHLYGVYQVLDLSKVKHFILDECDRLLAELDMRRDVQTIFMATPHEKQVRHSFHHTATSYYVCTLTFSTSSTTHFICHLSFPLQLRLYSVSLLLHICLLSVLLFNHFRQLIDLLLL